MTAAIYVDGSNLMFTGGKPSLRHLESLVSAIRNEKEKAARLDVEVYVFVDASTRHQMTAEDRAQYEHDEKRLKYHQAPAGVQADAFILREADRTGGIVVTGDRYREYEDQFPWLTDKGSGRVITAMYVSDWTFLERDAGSNNPRSLSEILQQTSSQRPTTSSTPRPPTSDTAPYSQAITRSRPHAMVLLVDQSSSMAQQWSGGGSKSVEVARVLNKLIMETVLTCTRTDGVRDYVHVAILGYGGSAGGTLRSLLPGSSLENALVPISQIAHSARIQEESTAGGRTRRVPVWVEPTADGSTPMSAAFRATRDLLKPWVDTHPDSFPPIVINLSDGESTDGSPVEPALAIRELRTSDGSTLVFNAHLASVGSSSDVIWWPASISSSSSQHVRNMFEASSVVPDPLRSRARGREVHIPQEGRGFVYNAALNDVVGMLEVGTPAWTAPQNRT